MNRILRSGAALVLLLALVIGVPLALIALAGWPLPSKVPDVRNMITMARQNNLQADFVVKSIALVVWLAWLQLMTAVVWEVAVNVPRLLSGRRQRRAPLVITPVANGVAKLFSTILTAGLLSALVSQPAIALTSSRVDLSPDTSSISLESSRVERPAAAAANSMPEVHIAAVWVAQSDDSLWDIAEQALGDGSEVSLILQMNPDLDASQNLKGGIEIRLPSGSHVPSSRIQTTTERAVRSSEPATADIAATDITVTADAKQYTVQANDGMWNVAEALLGDGSQHAELHDMLVGQEVAPGVVYTADTFVIHEGWVFTLAGQSAAVIVDTTTTTDAAAAAVTVESHIVVAGDTLSEIAEQQLGDAEAWPEIFEENAGRQMVDGRTFDDPNLILPGWQINVSADDLDVAEVTEVDVPAPIEAPAAVEVAPAVPSETKAPPAVSASASDPTGVGTDIVDPNVLFAPPATSSATAAPPPTTTTTTTTTPAPIGEGAESNIGDERPDSPTAPSPIRIEHAALLAAGILALVGVRRRQRLRGALPRARVPEPPPSVVATERRLRTVDSGERSLRVDVAIRAAAHELVDTDAQIGTVIVDHDGGIEMRLTGRADLHSPWVGIGDDQQSWQLPAALPIELLGEAARRVGTPCVALVQLGVADGRDVLIDVEACGTLAVDASFPQSAEVLTALAAGLATSPYPARSTFSLRSLRTGGEMWEPAVILLGDKESQTHDLPSELPAPGRGIGLIAATNGSGFPTADARLVGSSTGWRFDAFDTSIELTPVGIDDAELAAVSELIDDASAPLSLTDEITWAASDIAGAAEMHEELHIDGLQTDDSHSDDAPLGAPQPVETVSVFESQEHQIMVRLMGGVEVVSHDDRLGVFERSKTVELIAWLATHRSSSTRGAARTALWELDVRDATFANVVSEARRALARLVTPPGDDEWVGRTLTEQLPLHDGVVTDADLIQERLTAARLQPPAQAIQTLTPAAELIRDIPFAGTSYLWPDAEGITSNLVLLATGVSTELAGHALSVGDTDLVFWATGQGLKVLPGHEELIGLRMQAHARAGDLAGVRQEWESYERVIVADAWSDGEPAPKLLALRHELLTSPA